MVAIASSRCLLCEPAGPQKRTHAPHTIYRYRAIWDNLTRENHRNSPATTTRLRIYCRTTVQSDTLLAGSPPVAHSPARAVESRAGKARADDIQMMGAKWEQSTHRWWDPQKRCKRIRHRYIRVRMENGKARAKNTSVAITRVWEELEKDRSLISDSVKRADPSIDWIGPTNISTDRISLGDGFECCEGDGFIYLSTGWPNLSYHDHAPIDRACRSQRPDKGMSYD